MPGGDRTGPMGEGPMTGRGMGYCGAYGAPGYGSGFGGGPWARGRGRFGPGGGGGRGGRGGRGYRYGYHATGLPGWARGGYPPQFGWPIPPSAPVAGGAGAEISAAELKAEAEYLEEALGEIRKRLAELEAGAEE